MSVRFVLGASASYAAVLVADRLAGLLTLPVTTRTFSAADYGAILFLSNVSALASLVIGVNFAGALPTLVARSEAEKTIVTTILAFQTGAYAAVYIALAMWAPFVASRIFLDSALTNAVMMGAIGMFLYSISQALVGVARAFEMHHLYRRVQLPAIAIQTALVIGLLLSTSLGIAAIYLAMTVAAVLTIPSYLYRLRRRLFGPVSFYVAKQAVHLGLPLIPWHGVAIVTTSSAAFILARYASLEEAGLFAVANSVAAIFFFLTFSFEAAWTPYVLMRTDEPNVEQVLLRVFSLYSAVLLLAASGLALFAHEVFLILIGPQFHEAYRLVPFLTFAYCIFSFGYCFSQGILVCRANIHYSWIGFLVIGTFMLLCPILTVAYGAAGLVGAMAAAFLLMLVLLQVVAQSVYPIPYPWFRHTALWLVSAAMVMSAAFLEVSVGSFAIKIGVFAAIAALVFVTRAITTEDLKAASALLWKRYGGSRTAA